MREWHIGDPVDGTTDGWMDAQNWGHGNEEENNQSEWTNSNSGNAKRDEYSKRAWDYYNEFMDEDALTYINLALDLDKMHAGNWNRKGIILESLKRYEEAEECYNKSLRLSPNNVVSDNKARMLYSWAQQLLEESKELPNGLNKLNDAKEMVKKAITSLPGENSEEYIGKYLSLWDSISFYESYERKFHNNIEKLKAYPKEELFTIAGRNFHRGNATLSYGMPLRLEKEPDNEFDSDAIAVYVGDEKVGYVANNDHTKYELTSSASELQEKIPDTSQGEYLFYLERYSKVQFHIARIIKQQYIQTF